MAAQYIVDQLVVSMRYPTCSDLMFLVPGSTLSMAMKRLLFRYFLDRENVSKNLGTRKAVCVSPASGYLSSQPFHLILIAFLWNTVRFQVAENV